MLPWVAGDAFSSARMKANAGDYQTSGGSANAYTLTASAVSVYTAGDFYVFKANFGNTGSATLNVSAIGAKTIKGINGQNLANGAIVTGDIVTVWYDGTNFQLIAPIKTIVKILQGTRTIDTVSGTQSIAHGLGTTPKYIEVFAKVIGTSDDDFDLNSQGASDASVNMCTYSADTSTNPSRTTVNNDASNCIHLRKWNSGGAAETSQVATATFDATNIDLVWTKTGTGGYTDIMYFTIIAHM